MGQFLSGWLPKVLPGVKPWISADDIQKGQFWTSELRRSLKRHHIGIFCVTAENYNSPWLTYEAGALSNASGEGKVIPLLLNALPEQLEGSPLRLFQIVTLEREDVLRLLRSLNSTCDEPISKKSLSENLESHWPDLIKTMREIAEQRISGDSATVNKVVRALARHGIERSIPSYHIYFDGGFETHALYSTVAEIAQHRLLVFGRKNRKMFDRDHRDFFGGLKQRMARQFDFRVMFLDPDAPPEVLFGAHRDIDLADQIRSSIAQAGKTLRGCDIDAREHCRLYRIARTISFMIVDEVVLYSTLALDEKGRSQPLTNSPFTVVSASAPMAAEMVSNFETLWSLGSPVDA